MQNSRIRDCWTDVSRLRSYRCTIIASITSDGIRGEGGWMRLRGLTGDIRGWVERALSRARYPSSPRPRDVGWVSLRSTHLRLLRRGQITRERLRHALDQGQHVGMLLGVPTREHVGEALAPSGYRPIAHLAAGRGQHTIAGRGGPDDAALAQRVDRALELLLRNLQLR